MAITIYDTIILILRNNGEGNILFMLGKRVGVKSINYLHGVKIGISIAITKLNVQYPLELLISKSFCSVLFYNTIGHIMSNICYNILEENGTSQIK